MVLAAREETRMSVSAVGVLPVREWAGEWS